MEYRTSSKNTIPFINMLCHYIYMQSHSNLNVIPQIPLKYCWLLTKFSLLHSQGEFSMWSTKAHFHSRRFCWIWNTNNTCVVCLLDWGCDNLFLKLGRRCHWHLKMNRSVEVSLSFLAYDTQADDNYSEDDSHCEKKKKRGNARTLSGDYENLNGLQIRWEMKHYYINYIITHISLYYTPLALKKKRKTCYTNLLISKKNIEANH